MRNPFRLLLVAAGVAACAALAPAALAAGPNAIVALPSATSADACKDVVLPRSDDGSSAASVPLGFTANLLGKTIDSVWVNTNGSVSIGSPLGGVNYGQVLSDFGQPVIAPYRADVDTREAPSSQVTYSSPGATYQGYPAFCVDWVDVGYNPHHYDKLNSFQLLLVDRSDTGTGNLDIVFDYDKVQWETPLDSGSTIVGYTNGAGGLYQLPGSPDGPLLDSDATGLIHGSSGSGGQLGRYVFPIRNTAPPLGLEALVRSMTFVDFTLAGDLAHRAHVAEARIAAGKPGACRALDAFVVKVVSAASQDDFALPTAQARSLVAAAYATAATGSCAEASSPAPAAEAATIAILDTIANTGVTGPVAGQFRTATRQLGNAIALGKTASACRKVVSIALRTSIQRHKTLTDAQADGLVQNAQTVWKVLDCQS